MPATEQTWRNQKQMHVVFAVSSVVLLICTVWMFAVDHARSWKPYQRNIRTIDLAYTDWRELQFRTDDANAELEALNAELARIRGQGVDLELLEKFQDTVSEFAKDNAQRKPQFKRMDSLTKEIKAAAAEAQKARQAHTSKSLEVDKTKTQVEEVANDGDPAELNALLAKQRAEAEQLLEDAVAKEAVVANLQADLFGSLDRIIKNAQIDEDAALGKRKFKSADLDAAKGGIGLKVRDARPNEEKVAAQERINTLKGELAGRNKAYQTISAYRQRLQRLRDQMKGSEAELKKKIEDQEAGLNQLLVGRTERRSNYFEGIWPGKKWLELPILDAFNSPMKIDNLWHEGLEWDINFRKIRRFDRCTTCHQSIQKTLPGSAVDPAYEGQQFVQLNLLTAPPEDAAEGEKMDPLADAKGDIEQAMHNFFGLRFASEGLLAPNDLTISFVQPRSRAARTPLAIDSDGAISGEIVRSLPLQPAGKIAATKAEAPGLQVGDVITEINGDPVDNRLTAMYRLIDAAGQPSLRLTIRRGLPNPYTSHPRLDLFVGSLSPHSQAIFACTVCHEGQGSATDFEWASHTPNSPKDRKEWGDKYGWFDNHHWIFPMYPKRFAESACLKCHHNVRELLPSERYLEPPAPKLTRGHQLVAKYGCFGCHEITGFDSGERVGPDMRNEPNYFAAAQQLMVDPGYAKLSKGEQSLAAQLAAHPERDGVRHQLYQVLEQDRVADEPRLSVDAHNRLSPLLKDLENPGTLRRVGPSLRYVGAKLDRAFLYDWIREPAHFRASTRMPQFFGLWSHLDEQEIEEGVDDRLSTRQQEEIEIFSIAAYLELRSQPFEYLKRPEGITESTEAESVERGKRHFQTRCVACHTHKDFPEVGKYRPAHKIQQAPDLTGLAAKFEPKRNPNGVKWLYSWIKQPARYHVRTVMPNMILDPIEEKDAMGKVIAVHDPAADIVAYLMSEETTYQPAKGTLTGLDSEREKALDKVLENYLKDAFFEKRALRYRDSGIPASMEAELKEAEKELLIPDEQYDSNVEAVKADEEPKLDMKVKLAYVGRKTIAKYGCYGCHDIPGFEDAEPIGTVLAEWGRKEPSKLAFEHIHNYLHRGHGEADADEHAEAEEHGGSEGVEAGDEEEHGEEEEHEGHEHGAPHPTPFYMDQLNAGNRIGFIYQKLLEPRSYDYLKTRNKKYNERLRMPKFPFDEGEREAVITFVLGLVADPPTEKYIYKPSPREAAIQEGQEVLRKYNCDGCHVLEAEQLRLAFPPDFYDEQQQKPTFPFVLKDYLPEQKTKSAEVDRRNTLHGIVRGMPTVSDDGKARIYDDFGDELLEEDDYDPYKLEYSIDLWSPTLVGGNPYQVGELPLTVPSRFIDQRYASQGGDLAKYLLPHVVRWEKEVNPNAKGTEAWAWLPPPLVGQGAKVQTEWLHNFLLDPFPIRPAVVLRMPKFNMSPAEATKLVNYFAARDNVEFPYSYSARRRSGHLDGEDQAYQAKLKEMGVEGSRFEGAMNIVTSQNYCVKCHIVGDFAPTAPDRAKAPDLSKIYTRLRPDYVRRWIAKPTSILPYTAMPVNITYDAEKPHLGSTVPQDLYHGDAVQQVDAVVDLLMNFDAYTRSRASISEIVKQNAPPPGAVPPATGTE